MVGLAHDGKALDEFQRLYLLKKQIQINGTVFTLMIHQGQIQDWIRGGPDRDRPKLPTYAAVSCKQSEPFSTWGPGPALGPRKLLGISLLNMHSLHLGVPFYTIFEIIKY